MACSASFTASVCGVVAVAAQAVAQDDGVDAVVVEERNEVGALAADVQRVVPAARRQDDRRAGVEAAVDRVHFDGRIVDVDDAADPARHGLAHVVDFGLADLVRLEVRRAGRIQRDHHAALQDGLRSIGSFPERGLRRQQESGDDHGLTP